MFVIVAHAEDIMPGADYYDVHPATDRFHRIRRIAAQRFVACMAELAAAQLWLGVNRG